MNKSINVAFGATYDWLKYTKVTIFSILENRNENDYYNFVIMSNCNINEIHKAFLSLTKIENCSFYYIKMNDEDLKPYVHDWLGPSSSYRLKLSSLTNFNKILYMDSDAIATKNIAELYNFDIENFYVAGIEDKCSNMMKTRVQMGENHTFINGGVLLINLKNWRKDSLENKIFTILKNSTFYTDQDVVNDVCRNKMKILPYKYNLMPVGGYSNREEFENALNDHVILHYTEKPWKTNVELGEEWHKYNKMLEEFEQSTEE